MVLPPKVLFNQHGDIKLDYGRIGKRRLSERKRKHGRTPSEGENESCANLSHESPRAQESSTVHEVESSASGTGTT
ncbi:hypothetical protein OSTOST_03068 [Ostertagia ostertagi]